MGKISIAVLRGRRKSTRFKLDRDRSIELKGLYKALTNPSHYACILEMDEGCITLHTSPDQCDLHIDHSINVSMKGLLKLNATILTKEGSKQKISIERTLDLGSSRIPKYCTTITTTDLQSIREEFFSTIQPLVGKLVVPVLVD